MQNDDDTPRYSGMALTWISVVAFFVGMIAGAGGFTLAAWVIYGIGH